MIIHSDMLTRDNFSDAAALAGVRIVNLDERGSRSRARAFNITLSGSGRNGGMYGNLGYPTATWDEWGIVLAELFRLDPSARVPRVYEGAEHFHWATGDRYRTLTRDAAHVKHNWLSGDANGRSAGGYYYVQSCACGALLRRLGHGMTWNDFTYATGLTEAHTR